MAQGRGAERAEGDRRLRRIAIVGGGTAGWVAAAILARATPGFGCAITVVESAEIGTVGVGEATIPPFVDLLKFLGVDEADFIRHTQATYKLGIRFDDWRVQGERYWHPFGRCGAPVNRRPFPHAWHKARAEGVALDLADYAPCVALAQADRLMLGEGAAAAGVKHALHFDAALVARYLQAYARALGVERLERTVEGVTRRADGFLEALAFKGGGRLEADLFLDCTGFRGLLIAQTLGAGWVDWSGWLPCDRAVAAPTAVAAPRPAFTQAAARPAGWRWRIPLQHRAGNGYVYASAAVSDEAAHDDLLSQLDGPPLADPRMLRFQAGRRRVTWEKNCVAVGLSSGFLEPLESTSIHLAISAVYALLEHFPDRDFEPANIAAYNAKLVDEVERIRDFIVLHYVLTARDDTDFWRQARATAPPDSLAERIELYRRTGRVRPMAGELFTDLSWFYVLEGMGVRPHAYDPLMDVVRPGQLRDMLARMRGEVAAVVRAAGMHDAQLPLAAAA